MQEFDLLEKILTRKLKRDSFIHFTTQEYHGGLQT